MVVKGKAIQLEEKEDVILNFRGVNPITIPVTSELLRKALAMYVAASK